MFRKLIPHICIVLAIVTTTLFILVQFNPGIADSSFYTIAMYAFFAAALASSGVLVAVNRKNQ